MGPDAAWREVKAGLAGFEVLKRGNCCKAEEVVIKY